MKDRIVWGMIGCGDVTEVKNGPGLYMAEDSFLKGIWNRTKEKAVKWTEKHGHGMVYENLEDLLSDPEIDIVYIATTPDTHADFAVRCAKAGKHALVEKPVALTLEEGMKIKEAFRKADRKCFVCFYRRNMNRYLRLKEILAGGEIGEIAGLQIIRTTGPISDPTAWRANPAISGGDEFTETDIHALDIMQMVMGSVDTFSFVNDKERATYSLCVRFKSGKAASGMWNYKSKTETDRFTILGTEGRIEFDFFHNDRPLKVWSVNGYYEEVVTDGANVGLNMEQAIVDELLGRGSYTGTLDNALETLAITSSMYKG